ncbi:MAG TPA: hypothetical protein VFG69_05670 [Nannocystaceae bacterium]|nr:hypothetical protein [Nannocystaceae bacterium]
MMAPRARARPGRRLAALVVVAIVAAAPRAATAQVPESVAPGDHALEVARAAFEVGLDAYRAGDYQRAVDSWTSAHRLVVLAVDDLQMERVLGFDLAQALLRLHAGDGTTAHYAQARLLLEEYILWIERPGHALTKDERQDLAHAKELLAIVEIDTAAAIGVRHADPLPPLAALAPSRYPSVDRAPVPAPPEPIDRLQREMNAAFIVGGASSGLALAFGIAVGALAADQHEHAPPTTKLDRAVAATAALTTLFGIVGVGAIGVGFWKRRAVLRASPTLSRTRIGVTAELAF